MSISDVYKAIETIESVCSAFENDYYPKMVKTFTDAKLGMLNDDRELICKIREHSNDIHTLAKKISFKRDYSS